MKLKFLDLKNENFTVQSVESNRTVTIREKEDYCINHNIIFLNRTGKEKIFFSYLDSKIYSVPSDEYTKYLKNFPNTGSFPKILLDLGIVKEKENQSFINSYVPPLKLFQQLQFNMSPNCSLRCKYCYASSGRRPETAAMPFGLAKKAIDYVSKYCEGKVRLVFVGEGEPTLEFGLLKKIVAYAKKKIKNVEVGTISTNGVISKEKADWLIENVDSLQVSCDGPAFIQDRYRPLLNGGGSSVYVEKTIKYFKKQNKDFRVRATVTEDTFGHEKEIVNYFYNLGVKKFMFGGLDHTGEAIEMESAPNLKQEKAADKKSVFEESIKLEELQDEIGMKEYDNGLLRIGSRVTCGISTKSFFVVDPYGNVSACDRHNSPYDFIANPFMKNFLFGKYNFKKKKFEIDFEKLDQIKKMVDLQMKNNHCSSCKLFSACGTVCLYHVALRHGTVTTKHSGCSPIDKKWPDLIFRYLSEKYFINKKPCLETKKGELFYNLIYHDFKLHPQKINNQMQDNPYIYIDNLKNLKPLAKRMINYKKDRRELTLFLLKFNIAKKLHNSDSGYKMVDFFNYLQENNVYFKVSKPIPRVVFGNEYDKVCEKYRIPKNYENCLELYTIKDDQVIFSNGKMGKKKFSKYENREEIYLDYKKMVQTNEFQTTRKTTKMEQ